MYGIELNDKNYIDLLIEKQKLFIENSEFSSMSSNIVPHKYLAEINNRVDAIMKIAKDDGCIPIFLTITAPSRYHPSSKRYNNETIHATTLYLSYIWKKLLSTNVIKRIKEDNRNTHYFRTYEPHKSGVPHLHSLFYIPKKYLLDFKRAFLSLMHDQLIKQYKFVFQFRKNGYKSNYEGSKAYILKYILKSLKSAVDGSMSDEAYWYAKHKIRRFSSSHSLVPLFTFRKIRYLEDYQNIYKVTLHHKAGRLVVSNEKRYIEIHYFNEKELEYDTKTLWVKPTNHRKIREFINRQAIKYVAPEIREPSFIPTPVYDENSNYIGSVDEDQVFTKSPYKHLSYDKYGDLELYELIKYLDTNIDNLDINYTRYGVFKEEAKRRELISGVPIPINEYDITFDFVDISLE